MRRLSRLAMRWVLTASVVAVAVFGAAPGGLAQTATGASTPAPTADGTSTPTATAAPTSSPTTLATLTSTPTATPQPAAAAAPVPGVDPVTFANAGGGGGSRNLVKVQNRLDNSLRVDGNVQLGRIPGPMVAPVNLAQAFSSCANCQTLAVALQVDLITPDSRRATPQNVAVAINYQCTDCDTIAFALQYVLTVDDPTHVPDRANQLVAEMRHQLVEMRGDRSLTLREAVYRVDSVVSQFQDLVMDLSEQRDESTAPTTPDAALPGG